MVFADGNAAASPPRSRRLRFVSSPLFTVLNPLDPPPGSTEDFGNLGTFASSCNTCLLSLPLTVPTPLEPAPLGENFGGVPTEFPSEAPPLVGPMLQPPKPPSVSAIFVSASREPPNSPTTASMKRPLGRQRPVTKLEGKKSFAVLLDLPSVMTVTKAGR